MKKTISSTNSSCLRTTFINAALDCWNEIKVIYLFKLNHIESYCIN